MKTQMSITDRKIQNLLTSGAVTVTGPTQIRNIKQRVAPGSVNAVNNTSAAGNSDGSLVAAAAGVTTAASATTPVIGRCYVCDEGMGTNQGHNLLTEMETLHTSVKLTSKIAGILGDGYMIIVSSEDLVCSRCTNLINYLDRLENDADRVRGKIINLLNKKYNIVDAEAGEALSLAMSGGGTINSMGSPATKLQKLNAGNAALRTHNDDAILNEVTRKVAFTPDKLVKSSTINTSLQQQQQQQQAGTGLETNRKTRKMYKCLACDYKTSDMRLFNTHYETCKNQKFQCKTCRIIFPNFGTLKGHMVREHSTPMDNTCSVCHVNFVNEAALRKHMEGMHATDVVVTSTTTIPTNAQQLLQPQQQQQTQQQTDGGGAGSVAATTATNSGSNDKRGSVLRLLQEAHDVNDGDSTGASGSVFSVSMPSLDDDHNAEAEEQQANAAVAAVAAAAAAQENANAVNENEQHQQQQPQQQQHAQQPFTHKLDELAAAAEGSMELAESGIHQVAAAAVEAEQQHQQQQHELEQQHQQQLYLKNEFEFGEHQADVEGGGKKAGAAMDLEEATQAQVEDGQIKFLLNDGQLLQLNNHIITDADDKQILVQDPEQIQQLLPSVGVLQPGDGLDGAKQADETLKMMTDANGQKVLVQGENNEAQLIDASLLNADGQLVIQQGQDGELGEGAQVIGEDGTRIFVSISYTADGQPIVQVLEVAANENHEQQLQQQQLQPQQLQPQQLQPQHVGKVLDVENATGVVDVNDGNNGDVANSASGAFMALEELMHQQQRQQPEQQQVIYGADKAAHE